MATSEQAPISPRARDWALVTGATGGIGAEFARHLAHHGANLVLTGRNTEKLGDLARELGPSGAQMILLPVDLADRRAREGLYEELVSEGVGITTLVNNAGFGIIEHVADTAPDTLLTMLDVNVMALTHLTRLFLPGMLAAGSGSIINVSSTASYQPVPTMAAYAASKAYVRSFSTALWKETRGTGVRVVSISPGPTESGFFERAGNESAFRQRRTPSNVVETTFEALRQNRPTVVDGRVNRVMALATRAVPERLSARIAYLLSKR